MTLSYITPASDGASAEAIADRVIASGVTAARVSTTGRGNGLGASTPCIGLPVNPAPGQQVQIIPGGEDVGLVSSDSINGNDSTNMVIIPATATPDGGVETGVALAECTFANGNWIVSATYVDGDSVAVDALAAQARN